MRREIKLDNSSGAHVLIKLLSPVIHSEIYLLKNDKCHQNTSNITSGYIREELYVMWIIIIWSSRQIQVREWHRESCEIVCLNIDEPLVHALVNLV